MKLYKDEELDKEFRDKAPSYQAKLDLIEKLDGVFLQDGLTRIQAFELGAKLENEMTGTQAFTMRYRDHDIIIPGDPDTIRAKLK